MLARSSRHLAGYGKVGRRDARSWFMGPGVARFQECQRGSPRPLVGRGFRRLKNIALPSARSSEPVDPSLVKQVVRIRSGRELLPGRRRRI